ncbi:MAG: hypothetical protein ACP5I1_03045 [Candidatus Hinthialibacter sp.]
MSEKMNPVFALDDQITLAPVVHGSVNFALEIRRIFLQNRFDCLAVPLPHSFRESVLKAVNDLPFIQVAVREEPGGAWNYVPIDPCQPVIMALRIALQEYTPIEFIDRETAVYEPESFFSPDSYALKKTTLEKFCTTVLPAIPPPPDGSRQEARIATMADELHRLRAHYKNILAICPLSHWPWLREAYRARRTPPPEEPYFSSVYTFPVQERSLAFVLGELPFITYLYEKARRDFLSDEHLSIDGVKDLLLHARSEWLRKFEPLHNWATTQRLQILLQYVRNLTLLERRLTPDLYTLAVAAKQVIGDAYAISLVESAKMYPYQHIAERDGAAFGVDKAQFPTGGGGTVKNRLLGVPMEWRNLPLKRPPEKSQERKWKQLWNPFGICSWPPEDQRIESFNTHVRDAARAIIGEGLMRSEKFTASLKDGLDIRETIRNWYTGDLYVKEIPPSRGHIEAVIFLFETPADPKKYPLRTTWYAEHEEESTLSFFSTPIGEKFVGPGISQCLYGGCAFIFPPRPIPEIWNDPRFARYSTLEERLIAGIVFHSREKNVAIVCPRPPRSSWKAIARRYKKRFVYIPLSRFSQQTLDRLRIFHILNGKTVRSYAAKFIREI